MKNRFALMLALGLCLSLVPAFADEPARGLAASATFQYLPAGQAYDPEVPTPASHLGWEVGTWHVRHDALVHYLTRLAAGSDRMTVETQGYSHEGRPQILLTITSPRNHARLEEIRQARLAPGGPPKGAPAVLWLGYSIHGNEASGSNASLLVAYHLAAAQGEEIDRLLDEVIILIDPCLNPDGLGRFAQWANMHRGRQTVGDRFHREHLEVWPGGRTNHYWFDLNRDWLLLQHPESRARVRTVQRWRPDLSGDYHEMGADSTYFFQPGVPTRQNPLTPDRNLELTREIATFHAAALDRFGRLYFTEETFDDFYPGKGSTYPDLIGGVGVLFEQATVRGHQRDTSRGPLTFPEAVHNQFLTSLSMIAAAQAKGTALLDYRREFDRSALQLARQDEVAAYVLSHDGDVARGHHLVEILLQHGVEVHRLGRSVSLRGETFSPADSFVVPVEQRQYRLVKTLFERRQEFVDSTFYDVSAWTLPLAFGLRSAEVPRRDLAADLLAAKVAESSQPAFELEPASAEPYAYLLDWSAYYAPRAVYELLREGVGLRVAEKPFEVETARGRRAFAAGTVVIPTAGAEASLGPRLAEVGRRYGVPVDRVSSGLTAAGIDLGSPSSQVLRQPKPLLLVGPGVAAYEAGEIWHLLDHRTGVELPLVEGSRLTGVDLDRYTHLLMVDGDYKRLPEETVEAIRRWVRRGGIVVATRRAARWAGSQLLELDEQEAAVAGNVGEGRRPYGDYDRDRQAEQISGAIFATELDLTHPLAFGFRNAMLPSFRTTTHVLRPPADAYSTVARYSESPLLAGYASRQRRNQIAGSAAVVATRLGRGVVVRMSDSANFRGFWYGTNRLYLNALFLAPLVDSTAPWR
ncbi:MAG: M14 family metallopeptidase [Acidobacteriota bacterium]